MALPVVTVASGGLPVVEATTGMPVTEAANLRGLAVTKIIGGKAGLAVVYVTESGQAPFTPTTWNPADKDDITLTNGNLTATYVSGSGFAGVRAVAGFASGKFYWENRVDTWVSTSTGVGIATSSAVMGAATSIGEALIYKSGSGAIWINNASTGSAIGAVTSGDTVGIALDIGARSIWFRKAPAGNWNGSGTANPATGTGGLSVSALTGALFPVFSAASPNEVCTANFGGSAFVGAVPSGFTAGWG